MAPAELCKKTSKELAPTELAEWRKQRAEKYFHENVVRGRTLLSSPHLPLNSRRLTSCLGVWWCVYARTRR